MAVFYQYSCFAVLFIVSSGWSKTFGCHCLGARIFGHGDTCLPDVSALSHDTTITRFQKLCMRFLGIITGNLCIIFQRQINNFNKVLVTKYGDQTVIPKCPNAQ